MFKKCYGFEGNGQYWKFKIPSFVQYIHDKICSSLHRSPQRILSEMHLCLRRIGLNCCIHLSDNMCAQCYYTMIDKYPFIKYSLMFLVRSGSNAGKELLVCISSWKSICKMLSICITSMCMYEAWLRNDTVVFGTVPSIEYSILQTAWRTSPFMEWGISTTQPANQKVWNATIRLSNQSVCKCMTCCAVHCCSGLMK